MSFQSPIIMLCKSINKPIRTSTNGSEKQNHDTSHQPVQNPSSLHKSVYVDLDDCNVGFTHWHPTSVTQNGNKLSGQGNFGGLWEWTSSTLEAHDGFKPMDLYPAYTGRLDLSDSKQRQS